MVEPSFLPPAQRAELEQIVRRPSKDHGVARRANVILFLDDGKSYTVIAEFLYLDDDTVRNWHKQYLSGGLDFLTTFNWKGGLGVCDIGLRFDSEVAPEDHSVPFAPEWLEAVASPDYIAKNGMLGAP